jgi:alpha-tubulin suppressor-like RCC1 family protein
LGDGRKTDSSTPVVVSGLSDAVAISAGSSHSCALLANQTAKCWGDNSKGQLGDGTGTDSPTPVAVSFLSGAVRLSAGYLSTCAVFSDGSAKCWGDNEFGQLGDGTTDNHTTPTLAVEGLAGARSISTGYHHACAFLVRGGARCWGNNTDGELGNGTTTGALTPVAVSNVNTAIAISAGEQSHGCVVLANETARCWGSNAFGELGNGTTTGSPKPVAVSRSEGSVAVSAGAHHSCALAENGIVRCWGNNATGQLGTGDTTTALRPVLVVGL